MARTLRLNREALTELTANDLESVVGGYPPEPTPPIYRITYTCPTQLCVPLTDACPTTTN